MVGYSLVNIFSSNTNTLSCLRINQPTKCINLSDLLLVVQIQLNMFQSSASFPFDLHSAAVSDSHLPCCAHAMLWPCRSSQGHDTARPSRDGLWATCPPSASSGNHAEFHEDCDQKRTKPPHNDPYLRLQRVVSAYYKKDDLLSCWTSSSDISGYHADFHEGHGTVGAGQGNSMACVN